jgi:hypothetical protein
MEVRVIRVEVQRGGDENGSDRIIVWLQNAEDNSISIVKISLVTSSI